MTLPESSDTMDQSSEELSVANGSHANEQRNTLITSMLGNVLLPLRQRNYQLLLSGQLISTLGDMLYAVAMPWFMLSSGAGVQALGIVLTAYGIPRVVGVLLGGTLSDRWRPRRLMLYMDMARTFLMGLLAVLAAQGHPSLWSLCLASAFLGLSAGIFFPASLAILPSLLPDEALQAGNAFQATSTQTANVVGAGIAGVIVGWLQPTGAFALDTVTFLISALTLALIHDVLTGTQQDTTREADAGQDAEQVQGPQTFWQFLRASRAMRFLLILTLFLNFGEAATLEVALPSFVHDQLHAGASSFGLMLTGFAAGAILGATFAGGLGNVKHPWLTSLLLFLGEGCLLATLPFTQNVIVEIGTMVLAGGCNSIGNVLALTLIQKVFPRHLLGRIMSAISFGVYGLYPFSVALSGVVIAHYGPLPVFLFTGISVGITCIIGVLQKDLWSLQD